MTAISNGVNNTHANLSSLYLSLSGIKKMMWGHLFSHRLHAEQETVNKTLIRMRLWLVSAEAVCREIQNDPSPISSLSLIETVTLCEQVGIQT